MDEKEEEEEEGEEGGGGVGRLKEQTKEERRWRRRRPPRSIALNPWEKSTYPPLSPLSLSSLSVASLRLSSQILHKRSDEKSQWNPTQNPYSPSTPPSPSLPPRLPGFFQFRHSSWRHVREMSGSVVEATGGISICFICFLN